LDTTAIIAAIETELENVQENLKSSLGTESMCTLEKSKGVTRSMKYLEGQQQEYHKALKYLRASKDIEGFRNYLGDEVIRNQKMLNSPVGKSGNWQEYLRGSLDALNRIQEIMGL
jgi:hypothetical protein